MRSIYECLFSREKSFLTDCRGNVALVFALTSIVLVSAAGGAIDMNNASRVRQDMQDALDVAVLAGLRANNEQMATVAGQVFSDNINTTTASSIQQSYVPGTIGNATSLTGTATFDNPTYMLKLIGMDSIKLSVTATALRSAAQTAAPCIYVLDPNGSQALLVNSGAQINAPGCEIAVKSNGTPAGMFNSGSKLDFKRVCMQGAKVTQNSTVVPNLALNCSSAADPYAGQLPTPASSACTFSNGNYNNATVNLTPGVYCGWFNFNNSSAKVNFAPGVYVIKNGGWNVNGGAWTGTGVTFYFADTSKIQFNSGIAATLSAPTTGTYKNLLFYEAANLPKSDFIFNDSVANDLTGVIWLPSRTVTWNAKSGVESDSLTLVTWRLILNNTTWTLTPLSESAGGQSVASVRLVK